MFRRMRINTQERAVSSDINRLQSFAIKGTTELWRHLLLIATSESNLATYTEAVTLTTPLTAEILRGLRVIPELATLNLAVGSGIVAMIDPSQAGADDSSAVLIQSDGVSTPGALVMTANASGSVRIDVIECRQNAIPDLTTDNRDIFDASTGLFTATSVTKEIEPQLEFRVRAGTPGAGFPGTASGWLPLCVAYVPNGATNNDAITFWDVRPLVEDRASSVSVATQDRIVQFDANWKRTGASAWVVDGEWRATFKGRKVGGVFRRGSPGTDADSIDFGDASNRQSGLAEGAGLQIFGYMCFPFGLPRWSRYTDAGSGSRVPREPKGIPILTTIAPTADGLPSSAISLAPVGFTGATTSDALFCFLNFSNASNQFGDVVVRNKVMNAQLYILSSGASSSEVALYSIDPATVPCPANAKAVWVSARSVWTQADGDARQIDYKMRLYRDGNAANPFIEINGGSTYWENNTGGNIPADPQTPSMRIPLPKNPTTPHLIGWNTGQIAVAAGTKTLIFNGWEF